MLAVGYLHAVLGSRYGSWKVSSKTNKYDNNLQLSSVDASRGRPSRTR